MTCKVVKVAGREVSPPLWLAPMAGLTHTAFRRLLLELGGVGFFTTEMLSARRLPSDNPLLALSLIRTPQERPIAYQLVTPNASEIPRAVAFVERVGADTVDLNLGCPDPGIRKWGGGSKLMESIDGAREVVRAAREATVLPLTAKIRLGEELNEDYLREFSLMLEGEGVDMLAVHARLRDEGYGRKPRWEWIGKVKEWLNIPVIGNGGIFTVDDAKKCIDMSGCDGLMIGRGAVRSPWLFNEIAREVYGVDIPPAEVFRPAIYRRFATLLEESFTPDKLLGRLVEFNSYFVKSYPFGHTLEMNVQNAKTYEEALAAAEKFFIRAEDSFEGWDIEKEVQ